MVPALFYSRSTDNYYMVFTLSKNDSTKYRFCVTSVVRKRKWFGDLIEPNQVKAQRTSDANRCQTALH